MEIELRRTYRFEAARHLPRFPPTHPCHRVHGHSFRVDVRLRGQLNPDTGIVVDYAEADAVMNPLVAKLDHRLLNDVAAENGYALLENPTNECIAIWLWQQAIGHLPQLTEVAVSETPDAEAIYKGGNDNDSTMAM